MRERTSQIDIDGEKYTEVFVPFSDGYGYCDAIYMCDENGDYSCLWKKLDSMANSVENHACRVECQTEFDGKLYAALVSYTGSSYGTRYIAVFDSKDGNVGWHAKKRLPVWAYGVKTLSVSADGIILTTFEQVNMNTVILSPYLVKTETLEGNPEENAAISRLKTGEVTSNITCMWVDQTVESAVITPTEIVSYTQKSLSGQYVNYSNAGLIYRDYDGNVKKTVYTDIIGASDGCVYASNGKIYVACTKVGAQGLPFWPATYDTSKIFLLTEGLVEAGTSVSRIQLPEGKYAEDRVVKFGSSYYIGKRAQIVGIDTAENTISSVDQFPIGSGYYLSADGHYITKGDTEICGDTSYSFGNAVIFEGKLYVQFGSGWPRIVHTYVVDIETGNIVSAAHKDIPGASGGENSLFFKGVT